MGKQIQVNPGDNFGRLVVVEESARHRQPSGKVVRRFLCRCECGAAVTANISHLRGGHTQSCGCLRHDVGVEVGGHNATHGYTGTPTFKCWDTMKQRCSNPNERNYPNYGGRGIVVCKRWMKFENFLADMGEKPDGLSIDRIDNNGNYEPGNCRWATWTQQARNKRNNVTATYLGETCCIGEWAQRTGISSSVIRQRIRRGWSTEDALTTSVGERKRI